MTRDDDLFTEVLLVSPDPGLYSFINQGALTVDGIDDVEEMKMTDVCCIKRGITQSTNLPINPFFLSAEYLFPHPIPFDEIHYQYTKKKNTTDSTNSRIFFQKFLDFPIPTNPLWRRRPILISFSCSYILQKPEVHSPFFNLIN